MADTPSSKKHQDTDPNAKEDNTRGGKEGGREDLVVLENQM